MLRSVAVLLLFYLVNAIFRALFQQQVAADSCDLLCEPHLHDISINRRQFQRKREENVSCMLFGEALFFVENVGPLFMRQSPSRPVASRTQNDSSTDFFLSFLPQYC